MYWEFVATIMVAAFLSPVMVLFSIAFFGAAGHLLEQAFLALNPPPPPFCSIDPTEHPMFAWAADGSGWIRGICVIRSR